MALPMAGKTYLRCQAHKAFIRFYSQRLKDEKTKALLDKIIRIDHAGEFGAKRIYQGQLAVLQGTPSGPIIQVVFHLVPLSNSIMITQKSEIKRFIFYTFSFSLKRVKTLDIRSESKSEVFYNYANFHLLKNPMERRLSYRGAWLDI